MTDIFSSDSYLISNANKLLKNVTESVDMKTQNTENYTGDTKGKELKIWEIKREYKSMFSCSETVERLIKVHCKLSCDEAIKSLPEIHRNMEE